MALRIWRTTDGSTWTMDVPPPGALDPGGLGVWWQDPNWSFEIASGYPGQPNAWIMLPSTGGAGHDILSGAEDCATFDTGSNAKPEDSFETGWSAQAVLTLPDGDKEASAFGGGAATQDSFENGWDANEQSQLELPTEDKDPAALGAAGADGFPRDSFEAADGWTVSVTLTLTPADKEAASFDVGAPEDKEDFEEEWGATASYESGTITWWSAWESWEAGWTTTLPW